MSENKHVILLLGGLFGPDGWVTSAGMLSLRSLLLRSGISVATYTWNNWIQAVDEITRNKYPKLAIVGYSGGGSRATYVADCFQGKFIIDLMVLYDPSPSWQMEEIGTNVKETVTYRNLNPMQPSPYGWLGGGIVRLKNGNTTTKTVVHNISMQHLLVQVDQSLHKMTMNYIKEM